MSSSFKGKLAQEITDWENTGLINTEQSRLLHERYDPRPFSGAIFLKWLGLFAIFMLATSLLGFVGTVLASFSPLFSTLCLLAVSFLIMRAGATLASNKAQKHPFSGQALLTIGLVGLYSSMTAFYLISGGRSWGAMHSVFLLLTSIAALLTAYHYHLRWPLLIGLLMLFHGVGSFSQYWGAGSYVLWIHDPRLMALVSLISIVGGVVHEQQLEQARFRRCIGFGHLYLIFGLLYLNLSLWILSLRWDSWIWIMLMVLGCLAQLVAGAHLKDSRFTGMGVVFLGICLYTRFYEYFWDALSKALFFTVAGLIGLALAYVFERQIKPAVTS